MKPENRVLFCSSKFMDPNGTIMMSACWLVREICLSGDQRHGNPASFLSAEACLFCVLDEYTYLQKFLTRDWNSFLYLHLLTIHCRELQVCNSCQTFSPINTRQKRNNIYLQKELQRGHKDSTSTPWSISSDQIVLECPLADGRCSCAFTSSEYRCTHIV